MNNSKSQEDLYYDPNNYLYQPNKSFINDGRTNINEYLKRAKS